MTPTRPGTLAAVALVLAVLAHLVVSASYGRLPSPTYGAPVALLVLAAVELALAKVVRDRVQHRFDAAGRPPRRALHPVQVARAAALAKASSLTGAVVLGVYGGALTWVAPRAGELAAAADDTPVLGAAVVAGVALVACALLLERACRVPDPPEDAAAGLGSNA